MTGELKAALSAEAKDNDRLEVARRCGASWHEVDTAVRDAVECGLMQRDMVCVTQIGIDESTGSADTPAWLLCISLMRAAEDCSGLAGTGQNRFRKAFSWKWKCCGRF